MKMELYVVQVVSWCGERAGYREWRQRSDIEALRHWQYIGNVERGVIHKVVLFKEVFPTGTRDVTVNRNTVLPR